MLTFNRKWVFLSVLLCASLLSASYLLAAPTSKTRQCIYNAQRAYFLAVDRALTNMVQGKRDCRQNITTVDNHLRCLNRVTDKYKRAIALARQRYQRSRWRCSHKKVLLNKDYLIYRPTRLPLLRR